MEKLVKAITLATSKVGTKELTNNNDGPFVNECMRLVNLDNQAQYEATGKGYAWCAGFVSWVLYGAGANVKPNAWAPAWFPADKIVKENYRPMDVFGHNYNKIENGHVGFIFYYPNDGDTFLSLEGNWGNCVGINIRKKTDVNAVARWI